MNQEEKLLAQFTMASHNSEKRGVLLSILDKQTKGQRLKSETITSLKVTKTEEKALIATIGLILWNDEKTIPKEWKMCLSELESQHFWDLENNEENINEKISKVPFDLLVRVFWGIYIEECPIVCQKSREIFSGVQLETFMDIINTRKSYIYEERLNYFYHTRLNLVSNNQISFLQSLVI